MSESIFLLIILILLGAISCLVLSIIYLTNQRKNDHFIYSRNIRIYQDENDTLRLALHNITNKSLNQRGEDDN